MSFAWTDEIIAEASRLWLAGSSATVIAKVIGAPTRNAVIGKLDRLGVKRPLAVTAANMVRGGKKAGGQRPVSHKQPKAPKQRKPEREFVCEIVEIDMAAAKTLLELCACECRWPTSDVPVGRGDEQKFCARAVVDDSAYCKTHRAKATDRSLRRVDEQFIDHFVRRIAA